MSTQRAHSNSFSRLLLLGLLSIAFARPASALPPEVAGEGKFVLIDLSGFTFQSGHDVTVTSGIQTIGPSNHYAFEVSGTLHGTGNIAKTFPPGTDFVAALNSLDPGLGGALHNAVFESLFADTYPLVNETINGSRGIFQLTGQISSGVANGVGTFQIKDLIFSALGFQDTSDTLVLDDARLLGVSVDIDRGDFGDGPAHAMDAQSDLVLVDSKKHKVSIAYLGGTSYLNKTAKKSISLALGGAKIPTGFKVVGTGDFDLDGSPDLLLFNAKSGQTEAILMNRFSPKNGTVANSTVLGPVLPAGFVPGGVGDFNLDSILNLLIYNPKTLQTEVIYLQKGMGLLGADLASSTQAGPPIPAGTQVLGTADFNDDGMVDILLFNPKTRATSVIFMNGLGAMSSKPGPVLPKGYVLVGAAGYDNNRSLDLAIYSSKAAQVKFYLMDGETFTPTKLQKGPVIPAGMDVIAPR